MNLPKWGGLSALVLAFIYVAGVAVNFTFLDMSGIVDSQARLDFAVSHRAGLSAFVLVLYSVFAAFLVVLTTALHKSSRPQATSLETVATIFGWMWATLLMGSGLLYQTGLAAVVELFRTNPVEAASLLRVVETLQEGLGCTMEIPGALWILLVSLSSLRTGRFPKTPSRIGIGVGVAGLLTIVPPLFLPAAAIYALASVVWFAWIGLDLLRNSPSDDLRPTP